MRSFGLLWETAITIAMILCLCGMAKEQLTYDVANYQALADADSPETIPPGTKITLQNWQKYKKFMQVWMQAAYSRKYKWHVGSEPEYTVEVGPTHHFPMDRKFLQDTEKYGGQAQLIPLLNGGFSWKNYVAGIAFPNPAELNLAPKLAYDTWANFRPKIMN